MTSRQSVSKYVKKKYNLLLSSNFINHLLVTLVAFVEQNVLPLNILCQRLMLRQTVKTHLCSRILVGASHQVVKRHILGHGHVAELEREYLPSGWSVWKRHEDDSVKATWTHQSLMDGTKLKKSLVNFHIL